MKTTENLVDDLAADLEPVRRPPTSVGAWVGWMLASVLFVLAAIHLAGPVRPGALEQLLDTPRFALEMALGTGAALVLALVAFRSAIPGLPVRKLVWSGLVLAILWLANFVAGFVYPVLEPSMLGKRDHCVFETLLYGLPPLLGLLYWQRRQFMLSPGQSACVAGLSAGLLPALYMQIACMYAPAHILMFHVAPALLLAVCAPILLRVWERLARTR